MDNREQLAERIEAADASETRGLLEEALRENVALRCLMGGGCDANNDGPHTTVKDGKDEFCIQCGEMTTRGKSKPWFNDDRLARTMARLRRDAALRAREG